MRFAVKPSPADESIIGTTTNTTKPENTSPPSTASDVEWRTQFCEDSMRQNYHDEKMRSKDERPARQQELSGIPAGVVEHVTLYI